MARLARLCLVEMVWPILILSSNDLSTRTLLHIKGNLFFVQIISPLLTKQSWEERSNVLISFFPYFCCFGNATLNKQEFYWEKNTSKALRRCSLQLFKCFQNEKDDKMVGNVENLGMVRAYLHFYQIVFKSVEKLCFCQVVRCFEKKCWSGSLLSKPPLEK